MFFAVSSESLCEEAQSGRCLYVAKKLATLCFTLTQFIVLSLCVELIISYILAIIAYFSNKKLNYIDYE